MIPAWARHLLALLLPSDVRAEIAGDLEERRSRLREERGSFPAEVWYLRQALATPIWLWTDRGGRTMRMFGEGKVRYALRALRRSSGFTATALVTLALGIGATTAVYSVVDGVLFESLPYPESERLVSVTHSLPGFGVEEAPSTYGTQLVFGEHARSLESVGLYSPATRNLTGIGTPERILTERVTPSLFRVLVASPELGRTFTAEEGTGEGTLAILSHDFWTSHFGRDPDVVGGDVVLDGAPHRIVGVMPAGFDFPDPDVALWTPLVIRPDQSRSGGFNFPAVARLADGASTEDAERELDALAPRFAERFEDLTPAGLEELGFRTHVRPYIDQIVGDVKTSLWILLGTVFFVLLIACANVANLMLVRAESRRRDVAVQTALGAGRAHLAGQHLIESLLLSGAGALLGTGVAAAGLVVVRRLGGSVLPRLDRIGIDPSVLLVTAGVAVLAAVIFGMVPVLRHRSLEVAQELREGSRTSTGGRAGLRARELLVAGQVALALVLLVGSGLLLRSFDRVRAVDPGFEAEDVLTFQLALPPSGYPDDASVASFHQRFLERLRAIGGVEAAGAVSTLPLSGDVGLNTLSIRSRMSTADGRGDLIEMRAATPGYFEALGIPVLQGRTVEWSDARDRIGAVVVSEKIASERIPGRRAVGEQLVTSSDPGEDAPWSTIVGVVADVHNSTLTKEPLGAIYFAPLQDEGRRLGWLTRTMSYALRTSLPPASLVPAVREALAEMDSGLPIAAVSTLEARLARDTERTFFTLTLLLVAAFTGLVLGAVGLYGVISHITAARTREIGLRMALGAAAASVRRRVVLRGLAVTFVGLLVGAPAAWAATRLLRGFLFEVPATDAVTWITVVGVLTGTSVLATWVPARRASSVDVMEALRSE